jgi:predicted PurR-regulated permease PerM
MLVKDEERQGQIRRNMKRISSDVKSYIWITSVISAITAGISFLVMSWLGFGEAGFWAFLAFVLNFIPTMGSILAVLLPAMYALIQFQALAPTLLLIIALGVIHFIMGNIVHPRMASRSLQMSQFAVILALAVWGAMWGVAGMFLAVPLTSILMIVFSNFETTRPAAILLSQEGHIEETR